MSSIVKASWVQRMREWWGVSRDLIFKIFKVKFLEKMERKLVDVKKYVETSNGCCMRNRLNKYNSDPKWKGFRNRVRIYLSWQQL